MSRLLILALAVIAVFAYQKAQAQVAETASAAPKNNGKILIAYYSWSGHTKKVAEAIQNEIGGDLFEIQPETAYSDDYKTVVDQAKKEINEGYRPALKNNVANIAQYDIVFIGSPNWWGTIAPVVSTFVEQNDLSGKTVVPFITHGSGGEQPSERRRDGRAGVVAAARRFHQHPGGSRIGADAPLGGDSLYNIITQGG